MLNEKKVPRVVFAVTPERRDREGKVVRREGEGYWSEVGKAFTNADESITIYLDAVPVSGKLQIRDARPRREEAAAGGAA